jgi:hypothetical protein
MYLFKLAKATKYIKFDNILWMQELSSINRELYISTNESLDFTIKMQHCEKLMMTLQCCTTICNTKHWHKSKYPKWIILILEPLDAKLVAQLVSWNWCLNNKWSKEISFFFFSQILWNICICSRILKVYY